MIETYSFSLAVELVLGQAQDFEVSQWTMRGLDVNLLVTNAPCEGFVTLKSVAVDGVTLSPFYNPKGRTSETAYPERDARYFWAKTSGGGVGLSVEPQLCDHGAVMHGRYTGLVPEGRKAGEKYTFIVSLKGFGLPQKNWADRAR